MAESKTKYWSAYYSKNGNSKSTRMVYAGPALTREAIKTQIRVAIRDANEHNNGMNYPLNDPNMEGIIDEAIAFQEEGNKLSKHIIEAMTMQLAHGHGI